MILLTNVLYLVDEASTSIKESVQIQIREENNLARIKLAGAWFTEDDEFI